MNTLQHAITAALLCGAVGFVLPAGAATTTNVPAKSGTDYGAGARETGTAAAVHDANSTTPDAKSGGTENGATERKPASKRSAANYAKPQGGSEKAEMMKTADLNQQSLRSVQTGDTFAPVVATNDTHATPSNGPRKNTVTKNKRPASTPAKAKSTL